MSNQATITIRVDKDLRDKFVKIAKINDSDASKLIRIFMKKYVSDNSQLELRV